MIELNPTKSRTLGAVALGVVAATLAMGCGSGDSAGPIGGEQTGASKAAITARGFTANGCVARGVFDITAPTAIDFVAMAPTDLRNVQMQLYTVDGKGLDTAVHKTAQPPNAQLVSLIDDPATDQVKNLVLANVGGDVGGAVGGAVGAAHSTSAMVGAYQNGSSANQQSTGASRYATNEGSQSGQSVGHQYSWNGNGTAAANANDGAQNNAAQTTQSAAMQSSATTLAFTDLSLLNASHLMLVINVTANGTNAALRLFQGSNGIVTDAQNFPIVTPACGAGA
jgi:hypothetical protein